MSYKFALNSLGERRNAKTVLSDWDCLIQISITGRISGMELLSLSNRNISQNLSKVRAVEPIRLLALLSLWSQIVCFALTLNISGDTSLLLHDSYLYVVLSYKITRNRIVLSFKDSSRKKLGRRPFFCEGHMNTITLPIFAQSHSWIA